MSDNDFPKLDGGWCDGMGCGRHQACFCDAYLKMREEFQRIYNKPWDSKDIDCQRVEKLWRMGIGAYESHFEKLLKEEQTHYNVMRASFKEQLKQAKEQ